MTKKHFDVLIIGAGISGISAAYHIQTNNPNKTFALLERRSNIGGTWDLFKYPGIRSDSDMYTMGFHFRPWTKQRSLALGSTIMEYLNETVDEFAIREKIRFGQHVKEASWSSDEALWTIITHNDDTGEKEVYTCNFLFSCSGYYNYDEGYTPDFKGWDRFKGRIVHPQKWTEDIDYDNKRVLLIGSGATAITLVPELSKKAKHVTMIQRSPTYLLSLPTEDKMAIWLNKTIPIKWAYKITRWKHIRLGRFWYWFSRKFPELMKKMIKKGIKKELGEDFDVETHFTPTYDPWDQRLCFVADNDLYDALNEKKASIVTDHIETFTEKGILMKSGTELEGDLIVTATGLNLIFLGGVELKVNGEPVDFSEKLSYRRMMFSDIPNLAQSFGYTNASWTLGCDLTSQYVSQLLNYMDEKGYAQCCPRVKNPDMELKPWLDFQPGYIKRKLHELPKQGNEEPWIVKQNYLYDRKSIKKGEIEDGVLEFSSPEKSADKQTNGKMKDSVVTTGEVQT